MATNDQPVHLTDEQLRLLSDWSARTGRSAQELLAEALTHYPLPDPETANSPRDDTFYDRLVRSGLLGCISGGPPDLSTNPAYMEGFGE